MYPQPTSRPSYRFVLDLSTITYQPTNQPTVIQHHLWKKAHIFVSPLPVSAPSIQPASHPSNTVMSASKLPDFLLFLLAAAVASANRSSINSAMPFPSSRRAVRRTLICCQKQQQQREQTTIIHTWGKANSTSSVDEQPAVVDSSIRAPPESIHEHIGSVEKEHRTFFVDCVDMSGQQQRRRPQIT